MIFWRRLRSGFQSALAHKSSLYLFIALALLFKAALMHYFFSLEGDKMLQVIGAKSLVQGNGLSLPMVDGFNLSKVYYQKLVAWPQGYSLLMAAVYFITENLIWSSYMIDVLSAAGFLFIYLLLLKKLAFTHWQIGLLLLFNGLAFSQDIVASTPTDLLSVTFLLLAVYYAMILSQKSRISVTHAVVAGFISFLPAFFRHLYLPVVPIIPVVMLLYGRLHKNNSQMAAAAIALVIHLGLCAYQLSFISSPNAFAGNNYTSAPSSLDFNFETLKRLHPFVLSSFINLDFAAQQISRLTGLHYVTIIRISEFMNIILCLILFSYAAAGFVFKRWKKAATAPDFFLFTSIIIGGLIVIELCALSVVSQPINGWTYVQEERYFKFVAVCLPIIVLRFFNSRNQVKQTLKTRVMYGSLLLIFSFEILHGLYFINKHQLLVKLHRGELSKNEFFLKSFINKYRSVGIDVVVGSGNLSYYGLASYYDAKAFLVNEDVNGLLYAEQPTMLLVVLEGKHLHNYKNFLAKPGVKQELVQNQTYFFSLYIPEHPSNKKIRLHLNQDD